jgi:prepilin-type N-terminal cleavage/methylation domain-containing protein/prepilin-type processing-associated H-X9-DG protein
MNKQKFTLLELIIVIAIIGILTTILLPSLSKARRSAKNAVCSSNLAQITRGAHIFAKQNNNKFWERKKDIKPTHIGRETNNAKHEFNIYNEFVNRELYSCPLAPEPINFEYVEQLNPRRTEAQYLLLWGQRTNAAYNSRGFENLLQETFTNNVNNVTPKEFSVLAMDYISEKQGGYFEASHVNGQPDDFQDGNQYYRRRGGRGGRSAIWMTNYGFLDGHVRGIRNIKWMDSRLDWVHVADGVDGYKAPMPEAD